MHHVSYELRSPLTNIIGYAELLGGESVGPLNPKQREYAGHVLKSSAALLAIINHILDLATIDNDALELDVEDVDVGQIIASASEGIQDRLLEADIKLNVVVQPDIGTFEADANRVRQVLFNLLSNAVGFSSARTDCLSGRHAPRRRHGFQGDRSGPRHSRRCHRPCF